MDKCIAWTRAHCHPEWPDPRFWEMFEEERPSSFPIAAASTGSTQFRPWCRRPASFGSTTTNILCERQCGRPPRRHSRLRRARPDPSGRGHRGGTSAPLWARGATVYTIVALRADSDAQAPRSAQRRAVQGLGVADRAGTGAAQLAGSNDGDRQMVKILAAVLSDGLPAVEAACLRRCPRASIRPTSSRANAIRGRR